MRVNDTAHGDPRTIIAGASGSIHSPPENINFHPDRSRTDLLIGSHGCPICARCGTTRPLELFGAPDIDASAVLTEMRHLAPQWLNGCALRECWFEPTFHKHVGKLCSGIQIHVETDHYDHAAFRPWRLQSLAFKAIRHLHPEYPIWRDFPYEYETTRLAIDVINGSEWLRTWVDDPAATVADLEAMTVPDEESWRSERQQFLIYR